MNDGYVQIKDGASVCVDGIWMRWPESYRHLKTLFKIDGIVRKRTRMRLTGVIYEWYQGRERAREASILAWFHDLKPLKNCI